jgi:hypothetical protein
LAKLSLFFFLKKVEFSPTHITMPHRALYYVRRLIIYIN